MNDPHRDDRHDHLGDPDQCPACAQLGLCRACGDALDALADYYEAEAREGGAA
jgi:hypothetical protein